MMSMIGPATTVTLTIKGIVWVCSKIKGRIAFSHNKHLISFNPWSSHYQIKEGNEVVFASRSVTECLENATEIVLDFYSEDIIFDFHASHVVPSWAPIQ
jgi:hypothetical protein